MTAQAWLLRIDSGGGRPANPPAGEREELIEQSGDWHSFVVTATALIDGEALEGIPVMQRIFNTGVAVWLEEERVLDAGCTAAGRRPCRA